MDFPVPVRNSNMRSDTFKTCSNFQAGPILLFFFLSRDTKIEKINLKLEVLNLNSSVAENS